LITKKTAQPTIPMLQNAKEIMENLNKKRKVIATGLTD